MNKIRNKINFKNIAIITMIAIFFILDRYLKNLALSKINQPGYGLLGDFFKFSFTPNFYIAFSLPLSGIVLNYLISLIILCLIFYIFYLILNKKYQYKIIIPLTIIILGAISNLLDRWQHGFVIDYLDLKYFTIFNIADLLISTAVCYLIITQTQISKSMIVAENFNFVLSVLSDLSRRSNGDQKYQMVSPTKENAIELLLLHDLRTLIAPAKKEGSFDQELLKKILMDEYREKLKSGKGSNFYNFRKVLENQEYQEHLLALLNNSENLN